MVGIEKLSNAVMTKMTRLVPTKVSINNIYITSMANKCTTKIDQLLIPLQWKNKAICPRAPGIMKDQKNNVTTI